MKKQILNLGEALSKADQRLINGGTPFSGVCNVNEDCGIGLICVCGDCINPRIPHIPCL
jgi:hypothetical protein